MKNYRLLILLLILLLTVGCDQAAKRVAISTLAGDPPRIFINGIVRFEYARNAGAMLSLGSNLPEAARTWIFVVGGGALLLFVAYTMIRKEILRPEELLGLGLILGGGTGNLIDRVIHDGTVVDFVSIGVGPLRTGIFNVADVAIMGGGVLLLFGLRESDEETEETVAHE